MGLSFIKMHGAGNDFAIFDGRQEVVRFADGQVRAIAARQTGIGCDQLIVLKISQSADLFMRIYNPDGSEASACGNATRCVAWLVMEERGLAACRIETKAGILACQRAGSGQVRVDMGRPGLEWRDIPLSEACDTLHLPVAEAGFSDPVGVSMGNPHMVFAVADVANVPLAAVGPVLEHHALFPERANVSFAQVMDRDSIRLRVWERGAGETLACGTAACATLVAISRRGLVGRKAAVALPGGVLEVEWNEASGHVWMTGPVARVFEGVVV